MALLLGADGKQWPQGTLAKTLTSDFDSGVLPSWVTLGSSGNDVGSSSADSTTDVDGVQITTAAIINRTATLLGPAFDFNKVRSCTLRLCWTQGQTTTRGVSFGFEGTNDGAWAQQIATNSMPLYVKAAGVASSHDTEYIAIDDNTRFNLTLLVTPYDGGIYLSEGEQVFGYWESAGSIGTGSVRPFVRVTSRTGSAVSIDVHQLAFTREWL